MNSKELKRLSRRELVEIIYQLKKNEQEMQEEIEALKNELQDKHIRIAASGSIADAAVSITNLFSTAQTTADLYLQEITYMKEKTEKECTKKVEDTEKECAQKVEDTEKKVKEILLDGEQKLADLVNRYQSQNAQWQQQSKSATTGQNKISEWLDLNYDQ